MATAQEIMGWLTELLGPGQGLPDSLTGPRTMMRPPPIVPGAVDPSIIADLSRTPNLDAAGRLERTPRPPPMVPRLDVVGKPGDESTERDPFPESATDVPDSLRLRTPPAGRTPPPIVPPFPTGEVRREPERLAPAEEEAVVTGALREQARRPPPIVPGSRPDQRGFGDYALAFLSGLSGEGGLREVRRLSESERSRNATYDAIIGRGGSAELARAITENQPLFAPILPTLFNPRTQIVNNRLVDTQTGRVIADFSSHILGPEQRLVSGTGQEIARGGPRRLSAEQLERMGGQGDTYTNVNRLDRSWNRDFTRPGTIWGGDIRDWLTRNGLVNNPGAVRAAEWWQEYRRHSELIERHGLFGAALTATEQAAWSRADINPNMAPDLIERNLQTRREIMHGVMRRRAQALIGEGYSEESVARAFGFTTPAEMLAERPPPIRRETQGNTQEQPPVRITTDEEYNRLPSGARFIGPDGRQRIKL
jgi:hypothetical protein